MMNEDIKSLLVSERGVRVEDYLSVDDVDKYVDKVSRLAEILTHYEGGKLTGCIAYYCNDLIERNVFVSLIIVTPDSRGKGLADMLLDAVILLARKRGMKKVRLEVKRENGRALRFYEKRGFSVKEELRESYALELSM
ncbi:GNAT family N-acetyltransferase [Halomonas kalidii]|uniref:GNAT family N-acetyltransferase n=1 Tax=Halomonas kalidii TaxID=3043293 RepID=A0ABT6VN04_9GAMM|nr:GNAT family N-acetyltransferase [Halomonas kalidii]MDI5934146.1 GNAT family N-acetyltransferase [Halomonas kalidii]